MAYNQLYSVAARQDSDDSGFFDGVTDFMQYGITSAATSGVLSMANTGVALANTFGGDYEYYDTEDTLNGMGLEQTADYYKEHQGALDTVGFVATSFIPGAAGVKAMRMALKGGSSSSIKLVSGLSEASNTGKYVKDMTAAVRAGASDAIGDTKRKAILSGFYKNAVEAAAFETAVAVTMNQSPVLNNEDLGYFDAVGNVMTSGEFYLGIGLGAGIGGIMDAAVTAHTATKVQRATQSEINKLANIKQAGDIRSLQGDKTALAAAELKKLEEGDVLAQAGDLGERVKENIATQSKVVDEELMMLTGKDTDVAGALKNFVTNPDMSAEQAAGMFAGAKSITRPWKSEHLTDVVSVPSSFKTDVEFEDTLIDWYKQGGYIKEGTTDEAVRKAIREQFEDTRGTAIRDPKTEDYKFFSMARIGDKYNLDSASEATAIKVLRHEMGHLTTDHLNTLMTKTAIGKRLHSEAEQLSRMVSGDKWKSVDIVEKNLAKGVLSPDEVLQVQKFAEYLRSPKEVLAESFAALDNPELYEKASKLAPNLVKLLHRNKLLQERFGDTKKIINLQTGEATTEAVEYTIADIGDVMVRGDTVVFGRNGEQAVNITKGFDVEKLTPQEANAYWYGWLAPNSKHSVHAGEIVQSTDLPRVAKFAKQFREGNMKLDDTITLRMPDGTNAELAAMDADDWLQVTKGELAERMRGAQIKDESFGDVAPVRNYNEIARVLDVDRNAAQFGSKNSNLDGSVWNFSEVNDPTKPMHAVARYDRNTLNSFEQAGMASVNERIKLNRMHADSLTTNYFGTMAAQLPDSMYKNIDNLNPSADISSADRAASALGSVQGEYFHGTSFFQHIGAFLDTHTKRQSKIIKDELAPFAEKIKGDQKALTELSVLDSVLRRDHYQFMPSVTDMFTARLGKIKGDAGIDPKKAGVAAEAEESLRKVLVAMEDAGLSDLASYSGKSQIWTEGAARAFNKMLDKGVTDANEWRRFSDEYIGDYKTGQTHRIESDAVADFWRAKVARNDKSVAAMQRVKHAKGFNTNARTGRMYPGAYDAQRMPFVAYVSDTADKAIAGNRSVGIVGATSEEGLRKKLLQVEQRYGNAVTVTTRQEKKRYLEMQGRYKRQDDTDDLLMDSELQKNGIAFDVLPEPDQNILSKYVDDAVNYETAVARNHIEVKYGEELASLRNFGREAADISTSMFGFLKDKGKALNAWQQQEKVMLNFSNNDAFGQYRAAQNSLDAKASEMFGGIYNAVAKGMRKTGTLVGLSKRIAGDDGWTKADIQHLEDTMEQYGFRGPYDKDGYAGREMLVNAPVHTRGVLSGLATRANGLVARTMLRLDAAHGLVNAMSLPIMLTPELRALRGLASEQLDKSLQIAGSVKVPGTVDIMPSNAKLMMQATKDFFTNRQLVEDYIERGIVPANIRDVLETTDLMADFGSAGTKGDIPAAKAAIHKMEDLLGKPTDYSEQFTHFVAARAAELVTAPYVKAGVISKGTADAAQQSFMRRVNGNYIAAQRPQLFQGWAGQTIGLFQTYQMNMMYNMFRYLGQDKRAAATLVAAQTSIFGVQSLPGFEWMNQKVLERTKGEADFYTSGQDMFGEEATEWGMYGIASNFTKPLVGEGIALYTRGNLSPMNATILPTSLDEIPAVRTLTNFVKSVGSFAGNAGGGAPATQAFYHALAHNGMNRPLQGIGQILQDGSTARSSGNMMIGVDALDWWSTATRLMGAKPLDESIAMENFYRMEKYKTDRAAGISKVGRAVKEFARSGDDFTGDVMTGFMQDYVKRGGDYNTFERWTLDQMTSATESQVNTMRDSVTTTEGRYLQRVMNQGVSDYE